MRRIITFQNIALTCVLLMLCRCSPNSFSGGTSTSENGRMAGIIVNSSGQPAPMAQVRLIPADYDPKKHNAAILIDTTGTDGRYIFSSIEPGNYNVFSVHLTDGTRCLAKRIRVDKDTVTVSSDTLLISGTIKVMLPNGLNDTNGYFYIPGTIIYTRLSENNGYALLDSVPAGVTLAVAYAVSGSTTKPQAIRDSVSVTPGGIATIAYSEWKSSAKLYLNSTATGANVAGTVMNFPVLVRLTSSNFDFTKALSGGEDIRFTKSDGSPLPYEIERWDAAAGAAAIWVRVDTVYGGNGTQSITMYWGNSSAAGQSNAGVVFDTAAGFQGVWHMNESSVPDVKDATGNHFDGIKSGSTVPAAADGEIGTAQEFDGSSSFIQMPGTADSKLNFPENGYYSISAWVFVDTLVDSTTHVIASKGHQQYFLKLYWGDGQHWEFTEYHDKVGWQVSPYSPAHARTWKFLVGVRDGNNQYLYLDGELVNNAYGVAVDSSARNTADDFSIGKYLRYAAYAGQGFCWFDGKIDEVRVSSKSLSADWIKLCYMNQKEPDALLKW